MYIICCLTAIWNIQTIFIRICAACATWIFHIMANLLMPTHQQLKTNLDENRKTHSPG